MDEWHGFDFLRMLNLNVSACKINSTKAKIAPGTRNKQKMLKMPLCSDKAGNKISDEF